MSWQLEWHLHRFLAPLIWYRIDFPRLRVVVRGVIFVFFGMVSLWQPSNHHHNWSDLEVVYVIARCDLDFQLLRF